MQEGASATYYLPLLLFYQDPDLPERILVPRQPIAHLELGALRFLIRRCGEPLSPDSSPHAMHVPIGHIKNDPGGGGDGKARGQVLTGIARR